MRRYRGRLRTSEALTPIQFSAVYTIIMFGFDLRQGQASPGRLPEELPVLFLPVQNCGVSIEHTRFPGTLSLSAKTVFAPGQSFASAYTGRVAASSFF
jgi:Creatinine amidohydrolase